MYSGVLEWVRPSSWGSGSVVVVERKRPGGRLILRSRLVPLSTHRSRRQAHTYQLTRNASTAWSALNALRRAGWRP